VTSALKVGSGTEATQTCHDARRVPWVSTRTLWALQRARNAFPGRSSLNRDRLCAGFARRGSFPNFKPRRHVRIATRTRPRDPAKARSAARVARQDITPQIRPRIVRSAALEDSGRQTQQTLRRAWTVRPDTARLQMPRLSVYRVCPRASKPASDRFHARHVASTLSQLFLQVKSVICAQQDAHLQKEASSARSVKRDP